QNLFRLTSGEPNLRWLHMNAVGLDVMIDDVSERTAALALQGPLSRAVLGQVSPADVSTLRYFRLVHTTVREIPVTISRTGYTGDLGYEIWVDAEHAVPLWDALMDAGAAYGITPAGIWALDLARIEAGLVMLDVDYHSAHRAVIEDQKSSPFELSLGWTVSADKGPFNGRRALRAAGGTRARARVEVRRAGRGLGIARAAVRRARPAAAAPHGRVADQHAGLPRRPPDRLRDQRLLVTAAEAVPRARAPAH